MGYCFTCGATADDLDATAMCAACRAAWRPSAPAAADLGTRTHPGSARDGPSRGLQEFASRLPVRPIPDQRRSRLHAPDGTSSA
jgi:hypothetical protein